jgi:hypothetical protein
MEKVPQFCTVCGSRLATESEVTGYDAYTGEANESHNLICNNPTIRVSGSFFKTTETINHPAWSNATGSWQQQ